MIGSPESQVVGTPFPGQLQCGWYVYTGNNLSSSNIKTLISRLILRQ